MSDIRQIRTALVSVYHKDGLDDILRALHQNGVKLLSTGGTWQFVESLGLPCQKVENITSYPSILGGRVKTLHPKIFGGILGRRNEADDAAEMTKYAIPPIDLVIVDLYPFEETVAAGGTTEEIIEKIDIGGISLIRAAAKNFNDVVVIPSKASYATLERLLQQEGAHTTLAQRRELALEAYKVSSHYDTAIAAWFEAQQATRS